MPATDRMLHRQVYTSHRLYGATMIVNAIIVFAMRECKDHK